MFSSYVVIFMWDYFVIIHCGDHLEWSFDWGIYVLLVQVSSIGDGKCKFINCGLPKWGGGGGGVSSCAVFFSCRSISL